MSQAGSFRIGGGGGAPIETITGNSGGPVGPDGANNINLLGSGTISVAGNPGTNTLTISVAGSVSNSFVTNSGTATPIAGVLDILGGSNISTSGATNVVTVNVSGTTNHAVQVGNVGGSLTSLAVGATNTVLLGNTGANPSFGQVPNAALVNSTITLSNGNNITVTGSPVALGGTASFNLTGTTNHALQLGNAGGSLTSLGVAANGQLPIGSAGADPVLATLTAGTGISISNGAGTITISSSGTTTLTYTSVTTSPYVVLITDDFLGVTTSSIAITIQLPNAPVTGRTWTIKDATGNAATNNITVTTIGGVVLLDGSATFVMNTAFESVDVLFNGTSYLIY